jgi:hypothetical protein
MRFAALIVASLAISACSFDSSEDAQGDASGSSYTIDEESGETTATFKTEEGTAKFRSGKDVPVDLPKGFTIYPGAEITSNTTFERGEEKGAMVFLETDASPEDLAKHYRKQAEDAGFEITMEMKFGGGQTFAGKSKDGRSIAFNAMAAGAGDSVALPQVDTEFGDQAVDPEDLGAEPKQEGEDGEADAKPVSTKTTAQIMIGAGLGS